MSEKPSSEKNIKGLKKSLTLMLQDSKIDPEEAFELRKKYDGEKKEIIFFTKEELSILREQFGNELTQDNFIGYIQELSEKYLETRVPDRDLLYDGLNRFVQFDQSPSVSINLRKREKPEGISPTDWQQAEKLLGLVKNTSIKNAKISFHPSSGPTLELDTYGSNLFLYLENDYIIVTGQNNQQVFVEKLSEEDFHNFLQNYDNTEFQRVLEAVGFTGGLTLAGVLAFTLRTGVSWLLGYIGTGFSLYKGHQIYKSYHLSQNDALQVIKDFQGDIDGVKSYLYLAQVGYIQSYNKGRFFTIDGEYLTVDQLTEKEKNIQPLQYQLLKGLKEKDFRPKKLESGKYELDMIGLFDSTTLHFEGDTVQFATSSFEQGKIFTFSNVKEAFEKIQTINEILKLEMELKSKQSYENSYDFHNVTGRMEEKIKEMRIQLSN